MIATLRTPRGLATAVLLLALAVLPLWALLEGFGPLRRVNWLKGLGVGGLLGLGAWFLVLGQARGGAKRQGAKHHPALGTFQHHLQQVRISAACGHHLKRALDCGGKLRFDRTKRHQQRRRNVRRSPGDPELRHFQERHPHDRRDQGEARATSTSLQLDNHWVPLS
mgnify:CR=1 FL=1